MTRVCRISLIITVSQDEINSLLVDSSIFGGHQTPPGCLVILTESSLFESRKVLNIIQAATIGLCIRISLIITVSHEINSLLTLQPGGI
jgi:hypothetical protein